MIETMVSMAVLAIGLLGLLQMNAIASGETGAARRETVAADVGRDLIDAFERLPYNHPALTDSGVPLNASFVDITNAAGLHQLTDVFVGRPLLGSAEQAYRADIQAGTLAVGWRVLDQGAVKWIAVMVQTGTGSTAKQTTFWTTKADVSQVIGGGAGNLPEL